MKKNMLDLMQNISDDTVLEFANVKTKKHKINRFGKYIAACFAIVLIVGISAGVGVEAKEYKTAISFFDENNLSTENLSRTEIKTIYKDIITQKFSYQKTAEIIIEKVSGYELVQQSFTPSELENLWNNIEDKNFYFNEKNITGVNYITGENDFVKLENEKEVWRISFENYWIQDYINIGENILAFGHKNVSSSLEKDYSIIALINPKGNIAWQKELENLDVSQVVYSNNEIAVFSRRDLEYFCFNKYDFNGNLILENETKIGVKGIWNAVAFGDNYLVEIVEKGIEEIFTVNSKGEMLESFSYSTEDYHYNIQNMIEFNGNVFFSAYSVPIQNAGYNHDEISEILQFAYEEKIMDKSEELTKKVQDNYKAVLLIFNESLETPQVFYQIDGSMGAEFEIDSDENLVWKVETIMDTFYSPMTSSFAIGGSSMLYEYKFNQNGNLMNITKTDEIVDFRK